MTDSSDSSTPPDESSKPVKPRTPKRGAFPTPKSEIEKAKPYIPDTSGEEDPGGKPDLPTDADGEKDD